MRLRPWVELARASNLPTVWTNVMVGAAIGALPGAMPGFTVLTTTLAVSLMYVGGMVLNDAADAAVDRVRSPGRPIPRGAVTAMQGYVVAVSLLAIGLAILRTISLETFAVGALLGACIVAYDLLHHIFPPSVLLMGLCRALVYAVGATAVTWPFSPLLGAAMGGSLAGYVVLLTFIARRADEGGADRRRWGALLLPWVLLPGGMPTGAGLAWRVLTGFVALAWIMLGAKRLFAGQQRGAVHAWLSGICLIDAYYLALLRQEAWAAAAVGCFVLTVLAQRRIAGT